jgi:predicted small lipoprotein YifL
LNSIFASPVSRLAVAVALVAALGLAGCGRKGPLDPPPLAGAAAAPAEIDPLTGEPRRVAPGRPAPKNEPFILDWLVN